ncbi:MAG: hypothetical protein AAGA75_11505 [Cyanobacteria bacterium P01_E01_bin.6]
MTQSHPQHPKSAYFGLDAVDETTTNEKAESGWAIAQCHPKWKIV